MAFIAMFLFVNGLNSIYLALIYATYGLTCCSHSRFDALHCTAQNNRAMCLLIFPLLLLVFPLSLSFRLSWFRNSVSSQFISPELFKLINKSARSFVDMCVCMYLQSKLHYKNCQVINLCCVHTLHVHK